MRHGALCCFNPKVDLKPSSSAQIRVRTKPGSEPRSPRPRLESSLLSYEFDAFSRVDIVCLACMITYTDTHTCQLAYFLDRPALLMEHAQKSVHVCLFEHSFVLFWHCKTEHVEIMCNRPLTYQAEVGGGLNCGTVNPLHNGTLQSNSNQNRTDRWVSPEPLTPHPLSHFQRMLSGVFSAFYFCPTTLWDFLCQNSQSEV